MIEVLINGSVGRLVVLISCFGCFVAGYFPFTCRAARGAQHVNGNIAHVFIHVLGGSRRPEWKRDLTFSFTFWATRAAQTVNGQFVFADPES